MPSTLVVVALGRGLAWVGAAGVELWGNGVHTASQGPIVWRIAGLKGGNGQETQAGCPGGWQTLRKCFVGTVVILVIGRGTARSNVGATRPGPEAGKSRRLKEQMLRLGSAKQVMVNDS